MADQGLPPHITPEYIAESRVPVIVGVVMSVTILSTIFVIARIFTRTRLTGSMFLDDYLVMIAAVRPLSRQSSEHVMWSSECLTYYRPVNGYAWDLQLRQP